jgi:alpha-tubulin suppressor-like RCC1 family protein
LSGQLGDGTPTYDRLTPGDASGLTSGVAAVDVGSEHTCAVATTGGLKCWGDNGHGQLGDGTTTRNAIALDVIDLTSGIAAVSAGDSHTCGLTTTGGLKCWGANGYGQLGDGTISSRANSGDVAGLTSGGAIVTAGWSHTCAVTTAGGAKCWGANNNGQLGDGTYTDRLTPVDVVGLSSGIRATVARSAHTCALTTTGGLECWGDNGDGQLGDGTTASRTTPVDVIGLTSGVAAVTTGSGHTCALTTTGGIKCWGANTYGQLGDGTTASRTTPVDVIGLTSGVIAVSAGYSHTCALTTPGGLKCWGYNAFGQLGDGTTASRATPADVNGLTSGVARAAAGGFHTCAVTTAGGLECWGDNSYGQLGDGTYAGRVVPADVVGLTSGVAAVAAGEEHTCTVTTAGGLKCWGDNGSGQLGNGAPTNRWTPVDVVGFESSVVADLAINHTTGAPGSHFTLTASGFLPGAMATVTVNGIQLTDSLAIDGGGNVTFLLNTIGADVGRYIITVSVNPSASTIFVLDPTAPMWPQDGSGPIYSVPAGIGYNQIVFLPLIVR